jgi:hypothetical protein
MRVCACFRVCVNVCFHIDVLRVCPLVCFRVCVCFHLCVCFHVCFRVCVLSCVRTEGGEVGPAVVEEERQSVQEQEQLGEATG